MPLVKRPRSKNYFIQFQLNGKTYIKSAKTTNKKLAQQLERQWRDELIAKQHLGVHERITLKDALQQYLESKKTLAFYPTMVGFARTVEEIIGGERYFDDLEKKDLLRFIQVRRTKGFSDQTIRHQINIVRGTWKLIKDLGYQVSELEFPDNLKPSKKRVRFLTLEEEHRLLAELDPRREGRGLKPYEQRSAQLKREMWAAQDIVVVLLDTGCRYSEIADIRWKDIDLKRRKIHIFRPKVQNESVLDMTDRVAEIITRRINAKDSAEFVFTNKSGGPRGYARQAIVKAMKRAKLGTTRIHDLRHTFASRMVQAGLSLQEVAELLGHADIKTTMIYAHLVPNAAAKKAAQTLNSLHENLRPANVVQLRAQ
jgi:integrase